MNKTPLTAIDAVLAPVIVAANKVRQVRDSLPPHVWNLVPLQFRKPIDELFVAVEQYDRVIGRMKDAGLM